MNFIRVFICGKSPLESVHFVDAAPDLRMERNLRRFDAGDSVVFLLLF